ncbi:MAG: hypothetical protein QW087_08190 [Methanomassiliicoccales archaeon]
MRDEQLKEMKIRINGNLLNTYPPNCAGCEISFTGNRMSIGGLRKRRIRFDSTAYSISFSIYRLRGFSKEICMEKGSD